MPGTRRFFASIPFHCAPNTADPAVVIKSTTWTGGTSGATGSGGASKGGVVGKTDAVGLVRLFAGIVVPFFGSPTIRKTRHQGRRRVTRVRESNLQSKGRRESRKGFV